MSSGALLLSIILAGVVGVFVLLPLVARSPDSTHHTRPRGTARQNQALETLGAEKLRVLRAIRDLDFDFDLGKIPDTAYQTQRVYLIRLWAAITHRLDEVEAEIAAQDARIEAEIAALRKRELV